MIAVVGISALRIPLADLVSGPFGLVGIWWMLALTAIARAAAMTSLWQWGGWERRAPERHPAERPSWSVTFEHAAHHAAHRLRHLRLVRGGGEGRPARYLPGRRAGGRDPCRPAGRRARGRLSARTRVVPLSAGHGPPGGGGSRASAPRAPPSRSGPTATGSSAPTTGCSRRCCGMREVEIVTLPLPPSPRPLSTAAISSPPPPPPLRAAPRWPRWGRPSAAMPERLTYADPRYEGKSVVGEIVYVDRFGTLITNLTPELGAAVRGARGRGTPDRPASAAPSLTCRRAGSWPMSVRAARWRSLYVTARRHGGWGWVWAGGSGRGWAD